MSLDSRYDFADRLPVFWKLDLKKQDMKEVEAEFQKFIEKTPFTDKNQINLTSITEENQDPYEGVGSIYSVKESKNITKESQYRFFIERFKNSFFHSLYLEISKISPLPIGRVRFMRLKPKTCYSFHRDNSIRYHLAIKTNPDCFLVFKEKGLIHIPADGLIYGTNTLLEHTAMNSSEEDRYHLVFSTAWTPDAEERLKVFQKR